MLLYLISTSNVIYNSNNYNNSKDTMVTVLLIFFEQDVLPITE